MYGRKETHREIKKRMVVDRSEVLPGYNGQKKRITGNSVEFGYLVGLILFIYLFLERGREGYREGEKQQCVVASHAPSTGNLV